MLNEQRNVPTVQALIHVHVLHVQHPFHTATSWRCVDSFLVAGPVSTQNKDSNLATYPASRTKGTSACILKLVILLPQASYLAAFVEQLQHRCYCFIHRNLVSMCICQHMDAVKGSYCFSHHAG